MRLVADSEFTGYLPGKAELDSKQRLILHFPKDNAS
jgi:hypothetical protein